MVTVLNKLNQPVTVNITKNRSIHFLAKESKDITFEDFNVPEMKEKVEAKTLIVLKIEDN